MPRLGNGTDSSILTRRDEKAIADVVLKATHVPALSLGIAHFLSKMFIQGDSQDLEKLFVDWCCKVSRNILQDAVDV